MSKVVLRITILLVSLPSLVLAAAPAQWLRLNTRVSEGSLGEAVGDYSLDGEAHGYPKYKQEGKGSRYLYRSPNGAWSITSSADNIAKSKGTVVSIEAADEPFGLRYRYYDKTSKTWRDDDALSVVDISLEVQSDQRAQEALARRQAEDQRHELAAEALAAADARKSAEKRALNLAALKAGWVHPDHEARKAAAAKMDALVAQALLAEEVAASAQAQAQEAALQAESVRNETAMHGGGAAAAGVNLDASSQPQATSTSPGAAAATTGEASLDVNVDSPLADGQLCAEASRNASLIAAAAATMEREEERAAWAATEAARASAEAEAFAAAFTAAYDAFEAPEDETQDVLAAADSLLSEDAVEGQKKLLLATDSRPYVRLKEAIAARMVKEAAAGKAAATALQLEVATLQAAAENAKAVHADAAAAARQALEGGASSVDADAKKAALALEAAAQAEANRAAALAEEASKQLKEQAAAAEEARVAEEESAKQRQAQAEATLAEARAQVAAEAEALALERAKISEEVATWRHNAKVAEEKAEAERADRAAQEAARKAEREREQQSALKEKEEASRASDALKISQESAAAAAASQAASSPQVAREQVEAGASQPIAPRDEGTTKHETRTHDSASSHGKALETVSDALVVLLLEDGGVAAVTAALTRGEPGATALATSALGAAFLVVVLFFTCALCACRGSSSSNAAASEAAARMEAAAAQARADAAQQLELEKQRLEMARLQGEQRAGEAEAAARLAEKQRLDSEAREARRLKAMEEMVERLQFENQRAADMFHDQAGEMEELRRSLLDVQTELSDVRRSQSSLNVLAGSGSSVNGGGGGGGGVNARLAGLRQSNQDILRSSRLSLTQSLRISRESFSGLPSSSVVAATTLGNESGLDSHHRSNGAVDSFGEFAGPAADKAALPFGSPMATASSMPRFGGVNASMSPVQAAAAAAAKNIEDTSLEGGLERNGRSFSGDEEGGIGGEGDEASQGSQEYDDDDGEYMDDEVRQVLEDAIVANYAEAEQEIEFGAGSIGMSFEDFSSVTQDPSVRPCGAVVVVTRVFEGSAAEHSGVQAGDLIVALNGDRIPADYTKDDVLEVLVGAARPLTISFKQRL